MAVRGNKESSITRCCWLVGFRWFGGLNEKFWFVIESILFRVCKSIARQKRHRSNSGTTNTKWPPKLDFMAH